MSAAYDRLADLATDTRFTAALTLRMRNRDTQTALAAVSDFAQHQHNLRAAHHGHALVLTIPTSRGDKPACMVITLNIGQDASPSCRLHYRGARYLTQVFPGGADDSDVGDTGTGTSYRVETQGRMLFC